MPSDSRQRVFLVVCSGILSMLAAGTSLFSQPPLLDSDPGLPAQLDSGTAVIELAWTDLAKVIRAHQPERERPFDAARSRPVAVRPVPAASWMDPFAQLAHLIGSWTGLPDREQIDRVHFRSVPRVVEKSSIPPPATGADREAPPAPVAAQPPDTPGLEDLRKLRISGLLIGPNLRAVRLGGFRLREGQEFELDRKGIAPASARHGTFKLIEVRQDCIVIEHLPSASRLIRSCDRRQRLPSAP